MAVSDVLTSTRAGLTRVLHAVRDLRQLHLVEFDSDTGRISLTPPGAEAATVVQGNDIRASASKLLGETV